MAPEQIEGKDADTRTDIYALGVVVYEMLTGKRPFVGKTPAGLIAAILTETPPPPAQLQPLVPLPLNHVVATCLARDPDRRWQSVRDVALSLKANSETSSTVSDVIAGRRGSWREGIAWVAAGIGLLVALATWASTSFAPAPPQPAAPVRATIPFAAGQRLAVHETPAFAVSPDGSTLAYVVTTSGGGTELYVRRLDSATASLVPNSSGAIYPQFSPDSQRIAFIVAEGLRHVPVAGGPPVTVTAPGTFLGVRGLAWGVDRAFIVSTFRTGLLRVPESGGVPTTLTEPDYDAGEKSHRWPFLVPGGQTALMTVSTADATSFSDARVEVVELGSGKRTKLLDGGSFARYLPTGHIVFARAGALFAAPFSAPALAIGGPPVSVLTPVMTEPAYGHAHFDISETGTLVYVGSGERRHNRTFVWVDTVGSRTPAIASRRAFVFGSISPDGTRVAASVEGATAEIWAYDVEHDKPTRLAYGWDNNNPVWTPDNQRILFASTRGRSHTNSVYGQPSDGTGTAERVVGNDSEHVLPCAVSSDGKVLLIIQRGEEQLWQIRSFSFTDRSVVPLPDSPPITQQRPTLSPDDRWVTYHSNHSGRDEVYVQAFPKGGRRWQVSAGGGTSPVWARDGRQLFYRRGDTVMVASIEPGMAFRSGVPRVLFKTDLVGPVDVGRDGRLLMIEPEEQEVITELSIVVNWFGELKRLTSTPR